MWKSKRRGWRALLLACVCLLWGGAVQARLYDDVVASGTLRVAVYRDFPPYSFERDAKAQGVDVDIARALADRMKLRLELLWMTPDETLDDDLRNYVWKGHYLDKDEANPLAPKHVADVMLRVPYDREYAYKRDSTGEIINDQVVMLAPYQRERWQVAFDSDKIEAVRTLAKLQYYPVGVEVDSVPAFYFTSAMNGRLRNSARHYASAPAAFSAMVNGEVAAIMAMRAEVDWLLFDQHDSRYRAAENGFPTLGRQAWDIGIAIRDGNQQLGYTLEEVIDGMVRSGDMGTLYARYGLTYEKPEFYTDTP